MIALLGLLIVVLSQVLNPVPGCEVDVASKLFAASDGICNPDINLPEGLQAVFEASNQEGYLKIIDFAIPIPETSLEEFFPTATNRENYSYFTGNGDREIYVVVKGNWHRTEYKLVYMRLWNRRFTWDEVHSLLFKDNILHLPVGTTLTFKTS